MLEALKYAILPALYLLNTVLLIVYTRESLEQETFKPALLICILIEVSAFVFYFNYNG